MSLLLYSVSYHILTTKTFQLQINSISDSHQQNSGIDRQFQYSKILRNPSTYTTVSTGFPINDLPLSQNELFVLLSHIAETSFWEILGESVFKSLPLKFQKSITQYWFLSQTCNLCYSYQLCIWIFRYPFRYLYNTRLLSSYLFWVAEDTFFEWSSSKREKIIINKEYYYKYTIVKNFKNTIFLKRKPLSGILWVVSSKKVC